MGYQNYSGVWLAQSDASYDWLANPRQAVSLSAGVDTVKIWQSYVLPTSAANLIVFGGGNYAAGNGLDNVLKADAPGVTLYGGAGDDVFVGTGGSGTNYVIAQGEGDKVIENFAAASDTVRLIGGPLTSFSAVSAAMSQQGADVVLNDGGTMIAVRNATIGEFQASNFALPMNYASLGTPTFSEDFANPQTIGTNWSTNFGYAGAGLNSFTLTHNNEQEIYTSPSFEGTSSAPLGLNPFSVNNGVLTISAQPVAAAQSAQMWGYSYSSGMISSNFTQTYGYFEVRAELPQGQGLWPAFWLEGAGNNEIDVLEGLGSDTRTAYNAVHSADVPSLGNASYNPYATGFHTYGVLWSPQTITYYIDGAPVWSTSTPADMNSPMHMIVNLAVGGNWPGSPDASTPWPAQMQVDYVRAYALPGAQTTSSGGGSTGAGSGTANLVQPAGAGQTLVGTAGADTFLFKALPWTPATITNFQAGVDHLDFSALYLNGYAGSDPVGGGYVSFIDDGAGGAKVLLNPAGPHAGTWPSYVADLVGVAASGLTSATLAGGAPAAAGTASSGVNTVVGASGYGQVLAATSASDRFVFKALPWTPATITGFHLGVDHLDVSALYANVYAGADPVSDGYVVFLDDQAGGTKVLVNPQGPNSGSWPAYVVDLQGVSTLGLTAAQVFGAGQGATAPAVGGQILTATSAGQSLVGGAGNDTLTASQGGGSLTGGGGADHYVFKTEPWSPVDITDFAAGTGVIDLTSVFKSAGYTGSNPIADHYLSVLDDGAGGSKILFNPYGASSAHPWADYIIHLDHVSPSSLVLTDFLW